MSVISQLISQLETSWAANLGVAQGVRAFRKGAHGKRIIFFNSSKNGRGLMPCEGELEYKYCLKLEFDNEVDAYFLQPFTLKISATKSYTPDVLVRFVSNDYNIVEIKPLGSLERESVVEVLRLAEGYIHGQGYSYFVITELDLQPEIEHVNRKTIYRAAPVQIPSSTAHHARSILGVDFEGKVSTARKRLIEKGFDNNIVESLILSGHVTFNSSFEYDDSAVISFNDE